MNENWEFCNSTGVKRVIGFETELVNCRVAAYLNMVLQGTANKDAPPLSSGL